MQERERMDRDDMSTARRTVAAQGLNVCRAGFCRPRHGVRTIHRTPHARFPIPTRQISALGEIADHAQAALLRALELLLEPLLLARRIAAVPRLETLLLD